MPGLFDSHNHLQRLASRPDFPQILAQTRAAGVGRMVVNGTTEADWPAVAALAAAHPDLVIPAFGLHPWYLAGRSPGWCDRLVAALVAHPGAALGEIGLDRWIPDYDWSDQCGVFLEQWRLAVAMNRVPVVHCLRAFGPLEDLLRHEPKPVRGWLLHSYGGPPEMVPTFVKLGASFSFSGHFLHPKKIADRAAAFRAVPPERLLLETDAPDMTPPADYRPFALADTAAPGADATPAAAGPVNHPANLAAIATGLSAILERPVSALAALTTTNARRLFGG